MKILWLTWKDRKNPLAGGAELVNEELAARLVKDGHEVCFIVGGYQGGATEERVEVNSEEKKACSYKIVRVGGRWSVYWHTYKYYKKHMVGWADVVIDEINTIPFFAKWYVQEKNILLVHQLCREIWFYQMFFPLSLIGYCIEPMYLWLLRDRTVITISESTRADLVRCGFDREKIHVISEGILLKPVTDLSQEKFEKPTILSLGSVRPMKRTLDIVKAFEIAKKNLPNLQLIVAGNMSDAYGEVVASHIKNSAYINDIQCVGGVSEEQKAELLRKAHVLAVTSVKEGWCLVVTEANSQGTPAVVYDVDGLRDSVRDGKTGLLCEENTPQNLSEKITEILRDQDAYEKLRKNAWEWSKDITFEKSYTGLISCLKAIL
jgi:glycosyltransferase involved in cell wall biosynthesis